MIDCQQTQKKQKKKQVPTYKKYKLQLSWSQQKKAINETF